jgi:hypothetical protein
MQTTATLPTHTIASDYMTHTTAGERKVINRLISATLEAGYSISVYDGEEWTLLYSTSAPRIKEMLATTGEDSLSIRNKIGQRIGQVWLVYGNEENGECVISDHTDNDTIGGLVRFALASY